MSTVNTGPTVLTLSSTFDISPANYTLADFDRVIISNVSPFLATVTIGSDQFWLQPYTADLFDLVTTGRPPNIAMQQAPGGPAAGAAGQPAYLTATWLQPNDIVADTYPTALTSAAIASAISGAVTTSYTETLLATVSGSASKSVAIPDGTQALRILVVNGSTRPRATGNTTGQPYPVLQQWGNAAGGPLESVFICAVDTKVDANVTITFGSVPNGSWFVVAINAAQQVSTYGAEVGIGGSGVPGFVAQVGGSDGANLQALLVDSSGRLTVTDSSRQASATDNSTAITPATANGTTTLANFGPTNTAVVVRSVVISGALSASSGGTTMRFFVNGAGTGIGGPLVTNVAVGPFIIVIPFPEGYSVPAAGPGVQQFSLVQTNDSAIVSLTGKVQAFVMR